MRLENKIDLSLYAVTDRSWIGTKELKDDVEKAILGGVTVVQIREKEADFDEFVKLALEVKSVTDRYGVPFIVNDNIEVALKVSAQGVHVGQSDMSTKRVREIVGNQMILGVSAQTVEQALEAQKYGADYIGVGTIFNTSTKGDAQSVEIETLRQICQKTDIPVVAIGGITEDNISQLNGTGIEGVAVVSAIFAKEDIKTASEKLKLLVKSL